MRSIWSGAISFGLVNIPVKLSSAIEAANELDFDECCTDSSIQLQIEYHKKQVRNLSTSHCSCVKKSTDQGFRNHPLDK